MEVLKPKYEPAAFPDQMHAGMNLRDYFAAAALQGLLAGRQARYPVDEAVRISYQYADEMLRERSKPETA